MSNSDTIIDISEIKNYLLNLQDQICKSLEQIDQQKKFSEDLWQHVHGGGGRTRILADGNVFEKVGVNFSHIYGEQLPKTISAQRPELVDRSFQAMGVSVVAHPLNPYVPTSHCNVRFFIAEKPQQKPVWWFGGGYDLTPYYGFIEDCVHWHQTAKNACDQMVTQFYDRFKKNADDYFFIRHRNEPRGIGGIFFDYFNELSFSQSFLLMRSVGDSFLQAYLPIIERRKHCPYGEPQREFQCYRRGRYVEFNLVYDRGTLFGLQSGGRTESILMSLPPQVIWRYNWQPPLGSEEARLYSEFLPPRNWIE